MSYSGRNFLKVYVKLDKNGVPVPKDSASPKSMQRINSAQVALNKAFKNTKTT